jgi:hypothetical protein
VACTIECIAGDHVGEGDGGVVSGCDYERVRVVGVLPWWEREIERCCAGKIFVEVRVEGGNAGVRGVYGGRVGQSDFV